MNRYPLWKYLLIAATLILAAIYALPNLFGETPAVQVSTNRQAIVINEQTENRVSAALQAATRVDLTRSWDGDGRLQVDKRDLVSDAADHTNHCCRRRRIWRNRQLGNRRRY